MILRTFFYIVMFSYVISVHLLLNSGLS